VIEDADHLRSPAGIACGIEFAENSANAEAKLMVRLGAFRNGNSRDGMASLAWHEEPIARSMTEGFDCGEAALNEFLPALRPQESRAGRSKTFLAIDHRKTNILGL